MFIGHFAASLAGKAAAPRVSLGTLFLAGQFADLLWPALVMAGVERVEIEPGITAFNALDFVSYPISHSLLMAVVWGLVVGLIYWLVRKNSRGALVVGVLVLSHWILDLIVHRPDLPLALGDSPRVGLGLWHSVPATLLIEALFFGAGVWVYSRMTRAADRVGKYAYWALIVFLAVVYIATSFGPPPPDASAIAGAGLSMWLLVAWGYWVDKHRVLATR